ncbi:ABC-type sulfate transport system permease component [Paraburkholderia sp. JPY419]
MGDQKAIRSTDIVVGHILSRREKRFRASEWVLPLPSLVLLAWPLLSLIGQTRWAESEPANGDWHAVKVSVTLSAFAMVVIFALGTPLSVWLARTGLGAREGSRIARSVFSFDAFSSDGNITCFRLRALRIRRSTSRGSRRFAYILEEAAQNLGCAEWQTFRHVSLPLAPREIAAAAIISCCASSGSSASYPSFRISHKAFQSSYMSIFRVTGYSQSTFSCG